MTTDEIMRLFGMGQAPSQDIDREFSVFWIALLAAKPAIRDRDQITLTKDNLRKAMRVAFMAGAKKGEV